MFLHLQAVHHPFVTGKPFTCPYRPPVEKVSPEKHHLVSTPSMTHTHTNTLGLWPYCVSGFNAVFVKWDIQVLTQFLHHGIPLIFLKPFDWPRICLDPLDFSIIMFDQVLHPFLCGNPSESWSSTCLPLCFLHVTWYKVHHHDVLVFSKKRKKKRGTLWYPDTCTYLAYPCWTESTLVLVLWYWMSEPILILDEVRISNHKHFIISYNFYSFLAYQHDKC